MTTDEASERIWVHKAVKEGRDAICKIAPPRDDYDDPFCVEYVLADLHHAQAERIARLERENAELRQRLGAEQPQQYAQAPLLGARVET